VKSSSTPSEAPATARVIALAGNPNSGKTSVFNALTGLRRKVGNYPGVTVERREGRMELPDGHAARLFDLPGTYSLYAASEDERIARDVLLGLAPGIPRPDVVIAVVDASNLERNLYLATQLLESGVPVVVALNMIDIAERSGTPVDAAALEKELGVPVVEVVGRTGQGAEELKAACARARTAGRLWRMPRLVEQALGRVREAVSAAGIVHPGAEDGEALRLLTYARDEDPSFATGGERLREVVRQGRAELEQEGIDRVALEAECRYALCRSLDEKARRPSTGRISTSERIDKLLTHRVLGPVIFVLVMGTIFQAVYTWAIPFMDWIELATRWAGHAARGVLGEGVLADLIVDGGIAGVGNVLVFLPQICLLFFFLTVLDDVGYLARAAFLVDRVMKGVGLHGKAFVPLMSSFACAVPGIMATRTMSNRRDRLLTMMVAPLISCSARLPVYVLLIGAFVPIGYQGLALLSMYLLSVTMALTAAWVLKRLLFRGESGTFLLELPTYKLPSAKQVIRTVLGRARIFTVQAGTVILAISIVLWFLAYYPRSEEIAEQAEQRIAAGENPAEVANWRDGLQIRQSYIGRLGKGIEPVIRPLGFDWRTGVGIISAFAAREVLVSTLGIVFSVGEADESSALLRDELRDAKRPDGMPAYTILSAISLMVFFVLACQCMATLAVVRRETNSLRWPLFLFSYMTVLAYLGSLAVYQGGLALGFG